MRPFFDPLMQDARRRLKQASRTALTAAPRVLMALGEPSDCMLEGKAGRKARMAARKERAAQNRLNKRILIKKAAAMRAEAASLGFRIDEAGRIEKQNVLQRAPTNVALNQIKRKVEASLVAGSARKNAIQKQRSERHKPSRPDCIEPGIPWDHIDASGSTAAFSGDEASLAAPTFSTLAVSDALTFKSAEKASNGEADSPHPAEASALSLEEDGRNAAVLGSGAALWEEIERLEADSAHWKAACEEAKAAKHEAEAALAGMKSVLQGRDGAEETIRLKELSCASRQLAKTLAHPDSAVTPSEALGIAASLYPDRICVLESASASAAKADRHFRNGRRLLRLLLKLADDYYDLLEEKGDAEARKVFSNAEYAAKESDATSGGRLGEMREFVYGGRRIRMSRHLRIGNAVDRTRTLRCYFAWVPEEGKIVIGYCGEHLPVSTFH